MTDPKPPDTATTTFEWDEALAVWVERTLTEEELAHRNSDEPPPPRPPDTATSTWESQTVEVAGVPTVQWIERLWTQEELEARAAEEARQAAGAAVRSIKSDIQAERARLQAVLDTPNSTINGSPASHVKEVARASLRIANAALDLARYVG